MTQLIDKLVGFEDTNNPSAPLAIRHSQEIPDEYIATLKRDKIDTLHTPMGDLYRVATVPVVIAEKWQREGFDIMTGKHTPQEIIARLRKEQLDAFVLTNKRI